MPGMFPATYLGGVPASESIPNAYEPLVAQPHCTFYSSGCVTITQAQMNSLLSEFACVFDKAGWVYQPGESCNLWGALVSAFGGGSGGNMAVTGIVRVNGQTGPVVNLKVGDIPGAAPLDSPNLIGNPTAPTQAPSDSTKRLANTQFVQNAIQAAIASIPGATPPPMASTTTPGLVQLASAGDIAAGAPGKVVDAAQLAAALNALPPEIHVTGAGAYNAATNILPLQMSDGSTVNLDMTAIINDAVAGAVAAASVELQGTFGAHIGFIFP